MTTEPNHNSASGIAWIDNGILYNEYHTELSLTSVLETEKASLAVLDEHHLQVVPVIVLLRDLDKEHFKLTFADYARVLCTFDIARHASGVWIIGVPQDVKETIQKINSYFSVHRIFFAETLKDAQEPAYLSKGSTASILDRI